MNWQQHFDAGQDYHGFLEAHGTPAHRQRWRAVYDQAALTVDQRGLLGGFVRRMNVLCLAGAWCGDCVNQCPILQRFAEATLAGGPPAVPGRIDLRFLDRDAHMDLQEALSINGGHRVPVVVLLSEDFHECARYGERTLSKYRELAAAQLGAACPTGIAGPDSSVLHAVTAEWLNEFERIQLMLRLSPRLREKHGD